MQPNQSQSSASSSTATSSPQRWSSTSTNECPAPRLTHLPTTGRNDHHHAANADIEEETECVCRATFSDDIASKYSAQKTGIKLHLCVCHIQDVSEDPWFSLTEELAPRSDYLSVPSSPPVDA